MIRTLAFERHRAYRTFRITGCGWQRDELFEMRDPKPGEDFGQNERLVLFGDVHGTGAVASERSAHVQIFPHCDH